MYEALNIHFNSKHRLAICRPHGLIDEHFAIQLLDFVTALEDASENPFNRLLDLTSVTGIPLSGAALNQYAQERRSATAQLPPFRTAIIAADPNAEGFAHLYALLMQGSKIEVAIFSGLPSAAQWLGVPDGDLSP